MEKGLSKFCRDVDRLSKELWRAGHFKTELPRKGDHLILVKGCKVVKIEVVDVVSSSVESTGVVTARVVSSPMLADDESLVGTLLSGSYAEGESRWSDRSDEMYQDYRLFIKVLVREKTFHRITGQLRKIVHTNNSSINIVFSHPSEPAMFQQSCSLRDVLRWSKPKRHYISVFTTLFNAGLSLIAMLHDESTAAMLMATCSAICFFCMHIELRRMKQRRDNFVAQKNAIDKDYQTIKSQVIISGLEPADRLELKRIVTRYHLLASEYTHPFLRGLGTCWVGRLSHEANTLPTEDLLYYIDQYRDELDLPD